MQLPSGQTDPEIGIFGLGLVGTALAECLIRSGRSVAGYDPDTQRSDLMKDLGGAVLKPDEIWRRRFVFSCVFDTDQLAQLIEHAPDGGGGFLISLSTCDPSRMSALGRLAAQKNRRLVEAPISGTSRQLASGNAVFLLAGDQGDIAAVDPLLKDCAQGRHNVGPLGNGNRAKLAVNLVLGLNRAAVAEGLVFAERLGLAPEAFLSLLQQTAASSAVMKTKGVKMAKRDFSAEGRITQSAKDFGLILDAAHQSGQALPFASVYADMMRDCIDNGEGGSDNASILRAIERRAGSDEDGA